jgi:hypothetical protein
MSTLWLVLAFAAGVASREIFAGFPMWLMSLSSAPEPEPEAFHDSDEYLAGRE